MAAARQTERIGSAKVPISQRRAVFVCLASAILPPGYELIRPRPAAGTRKHEGPQHRWSGPSIACH
ncbi:hypothetical protein GCM10009075_39010 [Sphingomonas trueperi]